MGVRDLVLRLKTGVYGIWFVDAVRADMLRMETGESRRESHKIKEAWLCVMQWSSVRIGYGSLNVLGGLIIG